MDLPEITFQPREIKEVDRDTLYLYCVVITVYYFFMFCWLTRR
jgi:hypothetical protein